MANQIARNFAIQGDAEAAAATADHIAAFWDPSMTAELLADGEGLDGIALRAVELLRRDPHPPHRTRATSLHGGSDAG
jgi:formate dehydrogenase subunit delta